MPDALRRRPAPTTGLAALAAGRAPGRGARRRSDRLRRGGVRVRPAARRRRTSRPSTSPCRCTTRRRRRRPAWSRDAAAAWVDAGSPTTLAHWRARLARVPIELPRGAARSPTACAPRSAGSSSTATGRASSPARAATGAPGSATARSPARRWPRWASPTRRAPSCAGMRPFQLPDGRVPCAVDRHGIDQAVEHDSHGQLVWGVVETFRLTGDRDLLRRAVAARARGGRRHRVAARPAHDRRVSRQRRLRPAAGVDQPRGLRLASRPLVLGRFLRRARARRRRRRRGRARRRRRRGAHRRAARRDARPTCARRSARAIADHGIDFVPGSVELGDFDPTSTAIAFDPCGEAALLPPAALARTFERYWSELEARRRGETPNEAYTPYEVRTAAALLMLGQPARALDAARLADRRPAPGALVRVAGDRLARPRARRASSATCRTAGWRRASCAPCAA